MDAAKQFIKEMSLPYYDDDFLTFVNQNDIQEYSAFMADEHFKLLLINRSLHMYDIFDNELSLEEGVYAGVAPDEGYNFTLEEVGIFRDKHLIAIKNATEMVDLYNEKISVYIKSQSLCKLD